MLLTALHPHGRCTVVPIRPSSRMRSMRRSGSAAPHSSWSPITKADRYSGPCLSLRTRPTPTCRLPVMAAGVSSLTVSARSFCDKLHPGVAALDDGFDLFQGQILLELQSQEPGSGSAWRRCARTGHRREWWLRCPRILFDLGLALPLFLGLAVGQLHVDPGDQATSQRCAERTRWARLRGWSAATLRSMSRMAEAGRGQLIGHGGVYHAHALEQFAHVVGAAARGRLVGHGRHPLHQPRLEQAAQAHQQNGVGAVAANPVLAASGQLLLDHGRRSPGPAR